MLGRVKRMWFYRERQRILWNIGHYCHGIPCLGVGERGTISILTFLCIAQLTILFLGKQRQVIWEGTLPILANLVLSICLYVCLLLFPATVIRHPEAIVRKDGLMYLTVPRKVQHSMELRQEFAAASYTTSTVKNMEQWIYECLHMLSWNCLFLHGSGLMLREWNHLLWLGSSCINKLY